MKTLGQICLCLSIVTIAGLTGTAIPASAETQAQKNQRCTYDWGRCNRGCKNYALNVKLAYQRHRALMRNYWARYQSLPADKRPAQPALPLTAEQKAFNEGSCKNRCRQRYNSCRQ